MTPTSCYTYISALIGTQTYPLVDNRIWIEEDDGLGAPPNHEISERGPLQHGDTRVDFRLDPRIIQHVFGVSGETEGKLYDARKRLLDIFRARSPSYPIKMRYELSNGETRQIDCFYLSDMSFPSKDRQSFYSTLAWRGFYQRVGVTLKANDPVFYDPVMKFINFDIGALTAGMLVPTPVPTRIGGSTLNQQTTVSYLGTWREYPIIRIFGPITDARIDNLTTGEKLQLKTGTVINIGDYYEIDCRYGYKTVKNAAGTNKIADLTDDSDLATFHFEEVDPGITTGENIIRVTGAFVTAASLVQIMYYHRYLGL